MGFPGYKSLGVSLTKVQTAAELTADGPTHKLGTRVSDDVGGEFVYVQAKGAIAAAKNVTMEIDYDVSALAGAGLMWAVSIVAIADDGAGWVQVKGVVSTAIVGTITADKAVVRLVDGSGYLIEPHATGGAVNDQDVVGIALAADVSNVGDVYLY